MAARESRSDFLHAGRQRRPWRPGAARVARDRSALVAEFQRARLLQAAVLVATERGYEGMSSTDVVDRAGVSRKTFYDLFANREECFLAVVEDTLARLAAVLVPLYEAQGSWSVRLRAALVVLLEFVEREPDASGLALSYLVGFGPSSDGLRGGVLARLEAVVDQGRAQAGPRQGLSPITAELVVGGVLAVVHARLQRGQRRLTALASPLMWVIVLPYLGPAAAGRELRRAAPERVALRAAPVRPVSAQPRGLEMHLTYRTGRVLETIAAVPGASNVQIAERAEIADQGQVSKLLARLARLGLVENTGVGQALGGSNAWHLTATGTELEAAIRRSAATTRS
jgi:AcrR family transcriptional regulator